MKNQRSRFLLVYPYPHIDSNPTMALLLETLAMRGNKVDVLFPQNSAFLFPKGMGDNVNFISKPSRYLALIMCLNLELLNNPFCICRKYFWQGNMRLFWV